MPGGSGGSALEAAGRLKNAVFVDTSAWYALADARDERHAAAVQTLRQLAAARRMVCTTNHVAGETYTLLRVRLGFEAAQAALQRMRESRMVERVFVPEEWEVEAERLLAQYADQDFSYVDATSFIAMRRLGLTSAFAFDHHFTVAGFHLVNA